MAGFLGEYEATIDAKGRFLLPGNLKKQMPDGTNTIVISRGFEKCLLLYPLKTWEAIEEKLKKYDNSKRGISEFSKNADIENKPQMCSKTCNYKLISSIMLTFFLLTLALKTFS